jgi:hypothetical protein
MLYLIENKIINDEDKKILRSYYTGKQNELSKRLEQQTKSIEVVDAFVVEIPNLFTSRK